MEGKTGITLGTCKAVWTACHAYRAIRMPGTIFMVMEYNCERGYEEENAEKISYSSVAHS
jgi:hypothetical protein